MAEMIGGIVIAVIVGLGLFLILRYFWLWYWKINDIVALLEGIDAKLMVIKNNLTNNINIESNDTNT